MVMSALCRDEFMDAAAAAERLRRAAITGGDAELEVESHYLLGISAFWAAELEEAAEHFTSVVERFEPATRRHHQLVYGHDPYVVCQSRLANTLWFLGRDDDAIATCEAALQVATEVGHPLSHDTAAIFGCVLAIDLDDLDRLRRATSLLGTLGMDSFPHRTKREALVGLLDVHDGRADAGVARIEAALAKCEGRNFYPGFQQTIRRALMAAYELAGDPTSGLAAVDAALAAGGTPLWSAEAHRLRAELLFARRAPIAEVNGALDRASAEAARQGAEGHRRRIAATRDRLGASP
jgi:hypothetical protein